MSSLRRQEELSTEKLSLVVREVDENDVVLPLKESCSPR